jgi:hypothetical protein
MRPEGRDDTWLRGEREKGAAKVGLVVGKMEK